MGASPAAGTAPCSSESHAAPYFGKGPSAKVPKYYFRKKGCVEAPGSRLQVAGTPQATKGWFIFVRPSRFLGASDRSTPARLVPLHSPPLRYNPVVGCRHRCRHDQPIHLAFQSAPPAAYHFAHGTPCDSGAGMTTRPLPQSGEHPPPRRPRRPMRPKPLMPIFRTMFECCGGARWAVRRRCRRTRRQG